MFLFLFEVAPVGYDMVEVDLDSATLEGKKRVVDCFSLGCIPKQPLLPSQSETSTLNCC